LTVLSKLKKNKYTTELFEIVHDDQNIYIILSYDGSKNLQEFLDCNIHLSVPFFSISSNKS